MKTVNRISQSGG